MYKLTENNNRLFNFLLSLTLMSMSQSLSATEADNLSIGGFVSQGVVHTSDNQFFDEKDNTSLNMTEASIQVSYQLSPNVSVSGQLLYRNWGKLEDSAVDYLMVNYNFLAINTLTMGLRFGRIKNDFGLYNLTRDIPSARPSIFLPQSIYLDIVRDTSTSSDGISLYANHHFSMGYLSWHFTYGKYPFSEDLTQSIIGDFAQGEFSAVGYNRHLKFTWEPNNNNWLVSIGYSDPGAKFIKQEGVIGDVALSDGEFNYKSLVFSYQYFAENWDFSFEFERKNVESSGFEFFITGLPKSSQTELPLVFEERIGNEAFYGQWRYLLSDSFTLMLRYDMFVANTKDRTGKKFAEVTNLPSHMRYTKTLTSGISWQISDKWRINFEGHFVEGTVVISPTVKIDNTKNDKKHWQLWALQASYSF